MYGRSSREAHHQNQGMITARAAPRQTVTRSITTIQGHPPREPAHDKEELSMTIDNTKTRGHAKPTIILSAEDYDRLFVLARAARKRMPGLADELADEIGRAHVLAEGKHPQHIVCMNSEVEFRDDTTGKVQRVRLVYPEDADISQRKISVLTPVGTALIGLRDGHSITWETPNGQVRQLTVLSVQEPQDG
jgi:regulator of nucleoside diphosphate kinase